ncbi:MAG: nitroreductase family protein [Chloroflexi bacterium]|nr:nitroreductase family protein [Chloroflexota bacterium]
MQIDELVDLVRKRRSCRRFRPDPIPDEYIEKILEVARWAMSGANGQPWEFIVVKDRETIRRMAELGHSLQRDKWNIEKTRVKEVRHLMYQVEPQPGLPGFEDAPICIVVCGDQRTLQATTLTSSFINCEGGPQATYIKNVGNATHNLHLAAAALGLGAQWVTVNRSWEASLKTLLGVPAELDIHTIVPIGYPAHKARGGWRRPLEEITHHDRYDQSKYRSSDDIYQFLVDLRRRSKPGYDTSGPGQST